MEADPSPTASPARETAIATALYVVLSLLAIPYGIDLFTVNLVPFEGAEAVYRIDWFARFFAGRAPGFWFLPDLLPPGGIPLTQMSAGIAKECLAALLLPLAPAWVANNLLVVGTPITVALCAFRFSRVLTRCSFPASIAGGWLAGWTAFTALRYQSPWLVSTEGLILFLWAMVQLQEDPRPRRAVAAGAAAALAGWLFSQFFVHVILITAAWTLDTVLLRRWRALRQLPLVGSVALLLALPLLYHLFVDANPAFTVNTLGLIQGSSRLSSFVVPPVSSGLVGWVPGLLATIGIDSTPNHATYPGLVVLLLALSGLSTAHAGRRLLLLSALAGSLLSLGPVVSWGAHDALLPGPFAALDGIPFLRYAMRILCRFNTTTQLCLALLAAPGVDFLVRHAPSLRRVAPPLAILLHFLDTRAFVDPWADFAYRLPPTSKYDKVIAADPDDVAVLDIPYEPGIAQHMYAGAFHHKKVIWGFGGRQGPLSRSEAEEAFRFPGINVFLATDRGWDNATFARALFDYHVRYVVLHPPQLHAWPSVLRRAIETLEDRETWTGQQIVEPPWLVHDDPTVRVYRIEFCFPPDGPGFTVPMPSASGPS